MNKFLLSVIIPTHKRNKKLKKIINQLMRQCPLGIKIEIIIIGEIYKNSGFFFKNLTKKKKY